MMFDTDMFLFSLENLTVSNLNVNLAWLTYLFSSRIASERSAIVSQLSKIFCRFTSTPFFDWECKGKGFFISTKFFFIFFEKTSEAFGLKINLFSEELTRFFGSGRQRYGFVYYQQILLLIFLQNFLPFFLHNLQRTTRFFKRVAKIRAPCLPTNDFHQKYPPPFWNAVLMQVFSEKNFEIFCPKPPF